MNGCTAGGREQLVVALVTDGGQVWRWSAPLPFPPGPPDAATAAPLAATAPPTLRGAPPACWNCQPALLPVWRGRTPSHTR